MATPAGLRGWNEQAEGADCQQRRPPALVVADQSACRGAQGEKEAGGE